MSSNSSVIPGYAAQEDNSYVSKAPKRARESSLDDKDNTRSVKRLGAQDKTDRLQEFYSAVKLNDVKRMAALLKSGVNVNDCIANSDAPIFHAIDKNIGEDALKYLIENGADLRVKVKTLGCTLLHKAVSLGDKAKFDLLMKQNLDVNARGEDDVTPLHLAAKTANVEIARRLIERGADIECLTRASRLTPLHLVVDALVTGFHHCDQLPVIECLIDAGADVNARNAFGNTTLHIAALESRKNVIEALLKSGAYVDVTNANGDSPLHNAFKRFNAKGLTCLLEYGADINDVGREFAKIREYESSRVNGFCNSVLEHTNKLRAADLPVDDVFQSDFHKSFWRSHRAECSREVEQLKRHLIDDGVSLYDFLHMTVRRRRAYVPYVSLDLETKFPKYYGIVCGSYRQAVVRRSLIDLSKMVWRHLTEIELPDVCFECIFHHLRNAELTFFVAGAHCYFKN